MAQINIGGTFHSTATGNVVANADEILDVSRNKKQSMVNEEMDSALADHSERIGDLETAVGTGGSVDERIAAAVEGVAYVEPDDSTAPIAGFDPQTDTVWNKEQVLSSSQKEQILSNLGLDTELALLHEQYDALTQSDIIVGSLPVSGVANKIYRVPGTTDYADYMWYNSDFVLLATYDNAIDDEPTDSSNNLVKSGGVKAYVDEEVGQLGQQSFVVEGLVFGDNNFDYYTSPYIPFGGGSFTWTPSEINNDVYMTAYDASYNQVNQWKASSATVSRSGVAATTAYVRVSFLKDTRAGNLVLNGKTVWDNVNFHYSTCRENATLLRYAGALMSGYLWIGHITAGNSQPIVSPKALCYYTASPNTYTNFKDSNNNAIAIPYDGNLYAIKSVFSNGKLSYWEKVQLPVLETSINRKIDERTCCFGGIIGTESSPRVNEYLNYPLYWYICNNPGTYTNFRDSNNEPIVVPNDGILYIIKEVINNNVRSFFLMKTNSLFEGINSICWDFCGVADLSISPKTPVNENRQVFYLCATAGTYEYFGNIEVNTGEICIIRSYFANHNFAGWVKNTVASNIADADGIADAVNQYFIDHPSSANQYVEFVTGANAYAILGPSQDGANTRLCVGVGISNLTNNTGIKNIALGIENMMNSTGQGNVAVGYHSLFRLTTGTENTGTGNEALDDNIEGSRNVGFGWGASKRNTDGNDNVSVGYRALHGNYTDGDYQNRPSFNRNTALGSDAMRYVKTGSNDNVAVGYSAAPKSDASNQIVIGSGAKGEKANQVILGNMSVQDMVVGDKRLTFNNDGTVTWVQLYGITYLQTRVSYSNDTPFVDKNGEFECYITVEDGYTLSTSSVKMGGVEISSTAFDSLTGRIYIAQVTGAVRIEMRAIQV